MKKPSARYLLISILVLSAVLLNIQSSALCSDFYWGQINLGKVLIDKNSTHTIQFPVDTVGASAVSDNYYFRFYYANFQGIQIDSITLKPGWPLKPSDVSASLPQKWCGKGTNIPVACNLRLPPDFLNPNESLPIVSYGFHVDATIRGRARWNFSGSIVDETFVLQCGIGGKGVDGDLAVTGPELLSNGDIKYGYRISGHTPMDYGTNPVEVELYYVNQAGNIIEPRIDARGLQKTTSGSSESFTVSAANIPPPREPAAAVMATVNRLSYALESDRANNQLSTPLPNIVVTTPVLKANGDVEISYEVKGTTLVSQPPPNLELWWSIDTNINSPALNTRLDSASTLVTPIAPAPAGVKVVTFRRDQILTPPPGAKYFMATVDVGNLTIEGNESDNVAVRLANDVSMVRASFSSNGNLKVEYRNLGSAFPAGAQPKVTAYWSESAILSEDATLAISTSVNLPLLYDQRTLWFTQKQLKTPPRFDNRGREVEAKYLIVKLDSGATTGSSGLLPEASEGNNQYVLELQPVSWELADAPGADTSASRVALWLEKYRRSIIKQANRWHVPPSAIAGAIAWEALFNQKHTSSLKFMGRHWNGPGKFHYTSFPPDPFAPPDPFPMVIDELHLLKFLPTRSDAELTTYLANPNGSIEYIAAEMCAYATFFEQYGYASVRNRPAVLGNLHQGSPWKNLTGVALGLGAKGPDYVPTARGTMAKWISRNKAYLAKALKIKINSPAPPPVAPGVRPLELTQTVPNRDETIFGSADLLTKTGATALAGVVHPELNMGVVALHPAGISLTQPPTGSSTVFYYSAQRNGAVILGGIVRATISILPPEGLTATDEGETAAKVDWKPYTKAQGFQIQYRKTVATNSKPGNSSKADTATRAAWNDGARVDGTQTSARQEGLESDTDYEFRIIARIRDGLNSPPSREARARTRTARLPVPLDLLVKSVHTTYAKIAWTDVTLGKNGHYEVEASTGGGAFKLLEPVPAEHGYDVRIDLLPGRIYKVRVVSVDGRRRSAPSNVVSIDTPSDAVQGLKVVSVTSRTIELKWRGMNGVIRFEIWISTNNAASFRLKEPVPADHYDKAIIDVSPQTHYIIVVKGIFDYGTGADSEPESVTTPGEASPTPTPTPSPKGPTELRLLAARRDEADIAWQEAHGELKYTIQRSKDGISSWRKIENTPADHGFKATISLPAGETWFIRVIAVFAEGPALPSNVIRVTTLGARISSLSVAAEGPTNDRFANALTIGGNPGKTTGSNIDASPEIGEPNHSGEIGGASVWYRLEAPANGTLSLNTSGSDFDTLLGVYSGAAVNALTEVASNDDSDLADLAEGASEAVFSVIKGNVYYIAVDGYDGAFGAIALNWEFILQQNGARPANDDFVNAQECLGNSGTLVGSNRNARKEAGEPDHARLTGEQSVWYSWKAPANGTLSLDTSGSGFDTVLGVYTGTAVNALTEVSSNDDASDTAVEDDVAYVGQTEPAVVNTSRLVMSVQASSLYFIAIDGYSSDGSCRLNWKFVAFAPTVTGFTPASGPVGTDVVIRGTNFTDVVGVSFNRTPATYRVDSPTQITSTVPIGATTGVVGVKTNAGECFSVGKFTVANSRFTSAGLITNSEHVGIAGAVVIISPAPPNMTSRQVTDNQGSFSWSNLPAGTYTLTPQMVGVTFRPPTRTVTAANPNSAFDASFSIKALVRTSNLKGVAGIKVTLRNRAGAFPPGVVNPLTTTSDGTAIFSGVPAGLYTLSLASQDYLISPASIGLGVRTAPRSANFLAVPAFRIYGRVATSNGTAIAGAQVTRSGSTSPVLTNSAGYYIFYGVPSGSYTVTPSITGRTFGPLSKSVTVNGADAPRQNFIGSGP